MGSEPEPKLLGHNYDGIQEYDNPLPGWWTFLFWACILFSPLYILYYHVGGGALVSDEYAASVREVDAKRAADAARSPVTEAALAELQANGAAMDSARSIFAAKCAVCHGPEGQGLIGPNLTDDYFIHGAELMDMHRTIAKGGRPGKGMVAWEAQLQPLEIKYLSAYVGTLVGTKPANPKAPEGTQVSQK